MSRSDSIHDYPSPSHHADHAAELRTSRSYRRIICTAQQNFLRNRMDQARVQELLQRLGFFYVEHQVNGISTDFSAGHIQEHLPLVVSLNMETFQLNGPYADLLLRMDSVLTRYRAEEDNILYMPPSRRQEWLADLAKAAGLSLSHLRAITRSIDQ